MPYLDYDRLDAIDAQAFRTARPYPWINPQGLLTPECYHTLLEHLPTQEQFTPSFGKPRAHGQRSHDRFLLAYHDSLPVAQAWKDFIAELRGPTYQNFLSRLLGTCAFTLRFHWHYTPRDCSISPHCDAKDKLGSHIFYFNTEQDWDPAWGGQTLLLDDGGRFPRNSAPHIDVAQQYGREQVVVWQQHFGIAPPALSPTDTRFLGHDPRYADLTDIELPRTETLKDVRARVLPYWHDVIVSEIKKGQQIFIVAHGNSLHALTSYLDGVAVEDIPRVKRPLTGEPFVYEFDQDAVPHRHYSLHRAPKLQRWLKTKLEQMHPRSKDHSCVG